MYVDIRRVSHTNGCDAALMVVLVEALGGCGGVMMMMMMMFLLMFVFTSHSDFESEVHTAPSHHTTETLHHALLI